MRVLSISSSSSSSSSSNQYLISSSMEFANVLKTQAEQHRTHQSRASSAIDIFAMNQIRFSYTVAKFLGKQSVALYKHCQAIKPKLVKRFFWFITSTKGWWKARRCSESDLMYVHKEAKCSRGRIATGVSQSLFHESQFEKVTFATQNKFIPHEHRNLRISPKQGNKYRFQRKDKNPGVQLFYDLNILICSRMRDRKSWSNFNSFWNSSTIYCCLIWRFLEFSSS